MQLDVIAASRFLTAQCRSSEVSDSAASDWPNEIGFQNAAVVN